MCMLSCWPESKRGNRKTFELKRVNKLHKSRLAMTFNVLKFKRIQMGHKMKATSNFGLKCQMSPYFGLPRIDLRSICDYWFRHHVWVKRAQTSEWRMKIPMMWFSARLQEHFNFRLLKENTWLEKSLLVSIKVQDKLLQYLMVRPKSVPAGVITCQQISFIRCLLFSA